MGPKQVPVSQELLDTLTALYKKAYTRISAEITGATAFGVAYRKSILKQIDAILASYADEAVGNIAPKLEESYKTGAADAVSQLNRLGQDVAVPTSFNNIHQEAIKGLVDETTKLFYEGVTGIKRSASNIITRAAREQATQELAVGKIGGKTLRTIKNMVSGEIQNNGIGALKDKAGRSWQLDTYTEMLVRTETTAARNRGLVNRMAQNDYDLVQVSTHGADDVCGDWEGEILSITGNTPGYKTVAEAQDGGLFHPNCRHALNVYIPDLAEQTD